MPGPLSWLPKDLVDDVQNWGFANTASSAMQSIGQMGASIMAPLGSQISQGMQQITPDAVGSRQYAVGSAEQPPTAYRQPPTVPDVQPFSLGKPEDWLRPAGTGAPAAAAPATDTSITLRPDAPPGPATSLLPPKPPTANGLPPTEQGFTLPPASAWLSQPVQAAAQVGAQLAVGSRPYAVGSSQQPPTANRLPPTGAPTANRQPPPAYANDPWAQKAYAAAVAAGHPNPVQFAEQMRWESGGFAPDVISGKRASSAGAQGIAQIMPSTAQGWGVDPLNPDAALGAAAKAMAGYYRDYGGDPEKALAAYNMGPGNLQKYGPRGLPETNAYIDKIGQATAKLGPPAPAPAPPPTAYGLPPTGSGATRQPTAGPAWGTYTPESIVPNQITEGAAQGLSSAEALAVCGPAAAVAFARANGRNPTLSEAKQLGQATGVWDVNAGMHGPASEVSLLDKMGVPARLQPGADPRTIASEVSAGRPVILDTPGHYFVATGYDPQSQQFEFGNSAGILRAAQGRTKFRLDELASLGMGAPRATILMGGGQ